MKGGVEIRKKREAVRKNEGREKVTERKRREEHRRMRGWREVVGERNEGEKRREGRREVEEGPRKCHEEIAPKNVSCHTTLFFLMGLKLCMLKLKLV